MSILYIHDPVTNELQQVGKDVPLPVELQNVILPATRGRTITRIAKVPGIGAAAAYADGDAFGTMITFRDVFPSDTRSGIVISAFLLDLDDEGIRIDMPLFVRPITVGLDNSAYAVPDADAMFCRGVVSFATFFDMVNWQISQVVNLGMRITSEDGNLYSQMISRGVPNIAAGSDPWVGIVVEPD